MVVRFAEAEAVAVFLDNDSAYSLCTWTVIYAAVDNIGLRVTGPLTPAFIAIDYYSIGFDLSFGSKVGKCRSGIRLRHGYGDHNLA